MSWNYFWAGTAGQQPRYNQFPFGGCAVGCGPTAWGILFAWGDRQPDPDFGAGRAAVGMSPWPVPAKPNPCASGPASADASTVLGCT